MRALPMWQPWASLVVMGVKRQETRPGPAPSTIVGHRIAIHACLTRDHDDVCGMEPFCFYTPDPDRLPHGALIGTVVVVDSTLITERSRTELSAYEPMEFSLGNYMPGRWAWQLEDPVMFDPVPWKGKQGIMIVPDSVIPDVDALVPQGRLL